MTSAWERLFARRAGAAARAVQRTSRAAPGAARMDPLPLVDAPGGVGTLAGVMSGARPYRPATGGRRHD